MSALAAFCELRIVVATSTIWPSANGLTQKRKLGLTELALFGIEKIQF
jgi:hypothetical protein